MIFIVLLIISAVAIASSAAFFSVYGLANTFSGTFYGVIVMGASLEAGKLMTASYLYRYWEHTHVVLRSVLLAVCLAVMLLTSGGIFGFLSTGYQADVLPLKQKSDQVKLLDEERTRNLARKLQIDDLMTKNTTTVTNVQAADGSIDKNAARVLHETTRSRESMVKQYKEEQKQVTIRISEIDKEILPLKQELIKTEAHVGPIIYVAKAFNLDPDNATKYLIYLIIFAFDPMAIALTLAVNVALRVRKEEKEEKEEKEANDKAVAPIPEALEPVWESPTAYTAAMTDDIEVFPEEEPLPEPIPVPLPRIHIPEMPAYTPSTFIMSPPSQQIPDPTPDEVVERPEENQGNEPASEPASEPTVALSIPEQKAMHRALDNSVKIIEPDPTYVNPVVDLPINARPMSGWSTGTIDAAKINELVAHYTTLKNKRAVTSLTRDELSDFMAIADVLQKHGFSMYL